MPRKRSHLIWTATGALLGLVSANASAQTATLSIQASGGNWTAFAATDSGTDNVGLATFAIDVVGTDGATVTTANFAAPGNGTLGFSQGFGGVEPDTGIDITGTQPVINFGGSAGVLQGVGKMPGSQDGIGWSFPVEIADGTYSGGSGILTVSPDFSIGAGIQSLNPVSAGKWEGPGNISTDIAISGSVAVPEPASVGLLALGGIGLLRRRQKRHLR
jgi:PEP-CTERM motif